METGLLQSSTTTSSETSSPSELLRLLPLWMLIAFQKKRPGEVYAGTARGRHRKTESGAVKRRRQRRALVARRSATVKVSR
ncbi:MAG TPA: hypothetical protein VK204_01225 [Nocardioidaceae bacterium]|nr:hypothetical protein [Nocardioidaceae bacterium]